MSLPAEVTPMTDSSHRAGERLTDLNRQVIACNLCPRLNDYRLQVSLEKRRMFRDQPYWGKPLPGFGDPAGELLIVGLAPAAHGGNRTGRMFTGDRSGDFLYRALHESGWANQPVSRGRDDGLELHGCYITAVARCAPPGNKPLPEEIRNCRRWLQAEIGLLSNVRAILALGRIAFDGYLATVWNQSDFPPRIAFRFAHGVDYPLPHGLPRLFASYHPSQQNTQTGRLTASMMTEVLEAIRAFLKKGRL